MGWWHNLDGGSCCGLRPPSARGLAWPAPLSRPLRPPTFLGTGGTLYPRWGLRPLRPAWGRRGIGTPILNFPRVRGHGDETVAKRDPARSQSDHSPVKRGHSAVIAPTAVRPRCDGLFPAVAALRRFSEQGDTLYPRRERRALHAAWETAASAFSHLARWDAS